MLLEGDVFGNSKRILLCKVYVHGLQGFKVVDICGSKLFKIVPQQGVNWEKWFKKIKSS